MVTQRKEREHIRRTKERERRRIQHEVYHKGQAIIHKKCVARVMAKSLLYNAGSENASLLEDLALLRMNISDSISEALFPKVVAGLAQNITSREDRNESLLAFLSTCEEQLKEIHQMYLKDQVQKRIQREENAKKAKEDFLAGRKERRDRRKLQRMSRDKKKIYGT
jgi:hypothetical protein